ncbi:hypothetical protein TH19_06495 [Thalassospira profundimaris]|uniref:Secretin/TonB short N-terminal domain-containing protein n=2 Tax=Thalassospira TaxID=168934 RepID=A0A367WCY3_9PROT|nr:hypothetical protein TH19_06495 [Thalassospira profundimaris]
MLIAIFGVSAHAQQSGPAANTGVTPETENTPAIIVTKYPFDIPAQPLMQALEKISELTGHPFSAVDGVNLAQDGNALSGTFDLQSALQALFDGTDLTFSLINGQIVVLERYAPETNDETMTAPIVVQASRAPGVALGSGSASGSTVYSSELIKGFVQGNNDPNMIFRANPNVQYVAPGQRDDGASATAEQDLRPQTLSISGGAIDQNNIRLDGIGINSIGGTDSSYNGESNLPDDDKSSINADDLYGLHPQSVYVSASILEQAEILDSNVSAKYGGFQGGVINYTVMDPSDTPTFSANISRAGSNWTDYHLKSEDTPDTEAREPRFSRLNFGSHASGPVAENWGLLLSAERKTAETTKTAGDDYFGRQVTTQSEADNILGKLQFKGDNGVKLTTQIIYAPYTQEWAATENYNSEMDITGDGVSTYVGLETPIDYEGFGFSNLKLDTKLSFNTSQNARESESNIRRQIRSGVAGSKYENLCGATNCYDGWYGDLSQTEQDLGYTADLTGDLWGGDVLVGADLHTIRANRRRPEDVFYYYSTSVNSNIVCADADDVACDDGDQVSRRRVKYNSFSGTTSFATGALYAEYGMLFDAVPFGELEVRPGLRLERETFLGNTNLAPRFNATYYTDWDISFTAGWNRYYSANMLSYALRDATPATTVESRTGTTSGTDIIYSDDWSYLSSGTKYNFSGAGLKTPFTDERTAAVSFPLPFLGGTTRLKWIEREGKDQFARDSTDSSLSTYTLSNDGSSSYSSYSVEWSKQIGGDPWGGRHAFSINGQYSERRTSNNTYYVTSDEDEGVYYKGNVIQTMDLNVLTGNLDEPIMFNATLYSSYLDDSLRTGLTGRYTMGYDTIKDSGSNITVDGESYDIYEDGYNKARFDLDMTLDYDVIREEHGVLTLNASIDNVLNRGGNHTLSSANPYRKGRTFWLGLTYTY